GGVARGGVGVWCGGLAPLPPPPPPRPPPPKPPPPPQPQPQRPQHLGERVPYCLFVPRPLPLHLLKLLAVQRVPQDHQAQAKPRQRVRPLHAQRRPHLWVFQPEELFAVEKRYLHAPPFAVRAAPPGRRAFPLVADQPPIPPPPLLGLLRVVQQGHGHRSLLAGVIPQHPADRLDPQHLLRLRQRELLLPRLPPQSVE